MNPARLLLSIAIFRIAKLEDFGTKSKAWQAEKSCFESVYKSVNYDC